MNSDTLVEVISSKLQDMSEQYFVLMSCGMHREAELIAQEGAMIAHAHDYNDVFLVLEDLTGNGIQV
jgi:hypothetical protein